MRGAGVGRHRRALAAGRRADVAEVFVAALDHPSASRTTFEVVWGKGPPPEDGPMLLRGLRPDPPETYEP